MQPSEALKEIEETGTFRCDAAKSFNLSKRDSLREEYRWLMEKMRQKIGKEPEGVTYPVWAWYKWEYENQCPDVNSAAFLQRNEDKVLFTLEVPENEALLTDFEAWQFVLMHTFVMKEEEEDFIEVDGLSEEELEEKIQNSWDNVFDVREVRGTDYTRGRFVQATFWEIKKEYILDKKVYERTI